MENHFFRVHSCCSSTSRKAVWQVINGTDPTSPAHANISLSAQEGRPLLAPLVVLCVGLVPCCWSSWHLAGWQKHVVNQVQTIKGSNQCYQWWGRGCSEKGGLRGHTVVKKKKKKNEIQKPDSHLPDSVWIPRGNRSASVGSRSYNPHISFISSFWGHGVNSHALMNSATLRENEPDSSREDQTILGSVHSKALRVPKGLR